MLIFYWRFSLWKHRFLHTTKYPVFSQLRHISLRRRSSYHPQSCSAGAPSHLSSHSFVCWVSSSFFVSFVGFYWRISWFKGCDHLNRCETKRFSYTHTHTRPFSSSCPTQIITEYWLGSLCDPESPCWPVTLYMTVCTRQSQAQLVAFSSSSSLHAHSSSGKHIDSFFFF